MEQEVSSEEKVKRKYTRRHPVIWGGRVLAPHEISRVRDQKKRKKRGRPRKRKAVKRRRQYSPNIYRGGSKEHMDAIRVPGALAGVPHGMLKKDAMVLWAKAREKAEWLMSEMEEAKVVVFNPDIPDDQMARAALVEAMAMAMSPMRDQMKLAALRTVLEYTKSKPATKTDLKVSTAEQWLEEVVSDHRALPAPGNPEALPNGLPVLGASLREDQD